MELNIALFDADGKLMLDHPFQKAVSAAFQPEPMNPPSSLSPSEFQQAFNASVQLEKRMLQRGQTYKVRRVQLHPVETQ